MKAPTSLLFALLAVPLMAADSDLTRPLEIPSDYLVTPFGYFHPSCVRHIADGETVLADGRVQHTDGRIDSNPPQCSFPSYSAGGSPGSIGSSYGESRTPATNGYVETVTAVTSTSYGKLTARWRVPPAPAGAGQTLFFFPAFEDIHDVKSIVQPVLQFGPSGAGGGNYWAIASWNCCLSGITDFSTLVNVSPSDVIAGAIVSTCAEPAMCPTWNIISEDLTTGRGTALMKSSSRGQVWNWAFGAAMEVYGVTDCANYPPNGGVVFAISLFDQDLNPIADPSWSKMPAGSDITPSCHFSLVSTPSLEKVGYQN